MFDNFDSMEQLEQISPVHCIATRVSIIFQGMLSNAIYQATVGCPTGDALLNIHQAAVGCPRCTNFVTDCILWILNLDERSLELGI